MKRNSLVPVTILIVVGVGVIYTMLLSPSPLLLKIGSYFSLTNDVAINMVVNISYLFIVTGCLVGSKLERRIDVIGLYKVALISCIIGAVLLVISTSSYYLLLAGRAFFGLGYGLAVPFFGAAVMKWYKPEAHVKMDTINGLFPFIGPFIALMVTVPLYHAFGDSWNLALAIWGIPLMVVLVLWRLFIQNSNLPVYSNDEVESNQNTKSTSGLGGKRSEGIFANLLKRREIRLLLLACICDFACYGYVGTVLPMYLEEAAGLGNAEASTLAAFAFPAVGVIGIVFGGFVLTRIGLRKPLLASGQILEVLGLFIAALGLYVSPFVLVGGVVLFAFGNAIWTPALYVVPMDLKDMTPARCAGAFALIGVFGEGGAFLAPIVGGCLTDSFTTMAGLADPIASHAVGLAWSLVAFGLFNIIGAVSMLRIHETGKRIKAHKCEQRDKEVLSDL